MLVLSAMTFVAAFVFFNDAVHFYMKEGKKSFYREIVKATGFAILGVVFVVI